MATLQTTIQLIFEGIDNASQTATGLATNLEKIGSSTVKATEPLANFTKGVLATEAAVIATGAALGILAADQAQKFEAAFREIATLVDQPVENLGALRDGILDYAQISTQSLDNIIKSTYDAISAGTDWRQAIDQVAQSEKLAVAGKAELSEANRILLQTTAAYAESNITTAAAADKLFTVVRTGVTTLPELSASLGGVVDIAAKGGVSIEELFAAIATLTKTQDTALAVTALKGVITSIISPSKEAAAAAAALGIEFSAANLESIGLVGILQQVQEKTGGSADKIAELFGNVRGLSGVLGLVTEEGKAFTANLEAQKNATGAVEEAYKKMASVLDTGADAVKVLAIQFGGPLLDAFYNSKAAITEITNILADAALDGGPLAGLGGIIKGFAEEIEGALTAIWKNLPAALEQADFSGFENGLKTLAASIKGLLESIFGDVDFTSVDGLATAITNAGKAFEQLSAYSAGALESFGPLLSQIGGLVDAFLQIDPATIALAGNIGGVATAMNTLLPSVNTLLLGFIAFGGQASAAMLALKAEVLALGTVLGGGTLAAALGKAGIAGAVGLLAFELTKLSGADKTLNDVLVPDALAGYEGATIGTVIADLVESLGNVGGESEKAGPKIAEVGGKLKDLGEQTQAEQMFDRLSDATNKNIDAYEKWLATLEKADNDTAVSSLEQIIEAAEKTADSLKDIKLELPPIEAPDNFKDLEFDFNLDDFNIGNAIDGLDRFYSAADKAKFGVLDLSGAAESATAKNDRYELSVKTADGTIKDLSQSLSESEYAAGKYSVTMDTWVEGVKTGTRTIEGFIEGNRAATEEATALEKAQKSLDDAFGKSGASVGAITGAFNEYMSALGQSGKLTADQFINLTKVVNDFEVAMEEIASNERIANIEATVSIKTAQLETDMERVKATFASLDNTITSTGDLIGSLFGDLTTTTDGFKALEIQEQIDLENKRRQEALDLQKKLAEAEIERIEAQTRSLSRGDPLIQIDGSGLKPELEAFMWAILSAIRVRANAEFADYLLGLGVSGAP